MWFKDLHLKLKAFRLRTFLIGNVGNKKREEREFGKVPSWMVPVTHGYHVVENGSFRSELGSDPDLVVVQREQVDELELWFFGVFNSRIGDGVTKYLQAHLFDKNPEQSQLNSKSKETLEKAYLNARAKIRQAKKAEERKRTGSASALVINGEKLLITHMGDYRTVVCRDGKAHQVSRRRQEGTKRHLPHKLIPGVKRLLKVRKVSAKSSEIVVGDERIDSDTEFVILASNGIWELWVQEQVNGGIGWRLEVVGYPKRLLVDAQENKFAHPLEKWMDIILTVMKHQEAVNLIRHMEDPQEAAERLAKEAFTRMSRSNISCLVIRFD